VRWCLEAVVVVPCPARLLAGEGKHHEPGHALGPLERVDVDFTHGVLLELGG
jgi:hypothetical protein